MTIEIGQIWEDADIRRRGRTFKISNIDNDTATCENLTGKGGIEPTKPISFVKLDRFIPKYYKLKHANIRTAISMDSISESMSEIVRMPIIIRNRERNDDVIETAKKHWPIGWFQSGPFIIAENDTFEITVRPNSTNSFTAKITLYNFCIYNAEITGSIEHCLDCVVNALLGIRNEIDLLMSPNKV